ncbi:MAG: DMT family transporter [Flavobacteriales bacterium]|nr:DMT family transporter [Flavobacteriales bacterium]MCB9192321.1 DMT family transporter [Flavobacteriales bacterium]MCB9203737.1 DMT family transporter [Flavobacteriales bacterium]
MQRAYLQMHVAIFLWGFTGILGRLISLQEYPLVWWRILITVIALGVFLKWRGELEPPPWKEMKKIAFVGGTIALHWVTFYGSIKYSNVSIALSAMASTALFTSILDPIMTKRKPKLSELVLGLFIILGIFLIFRFQKLYTVGISLGLISALLCAYFTIQTKSLLANHGPRNLLLYELIGGLATLTLLAPLYLYLFPAPALVPDFTDSGYLLLLSLICTVYAMQLSYQALQHVSPFVMNLSVNLEPVYSIVLAAFIFHEHEDLNLGFYAGASIVILAVAINGLLEWNTKRRARKQPLVMP